MEYKNNILIVINRRIKKILYSFLGCVVFLIGSSALVNYYSLPEIFIPILFLPCGGVFVYQIFLLKDIKCPYCKESLFTSLYFGKIPTEFKSLFGKKCNHCGAKLM